MRKRKLICKVHNGFLWFVTGIMFVVMILSVAAMDSETYLPVVTLFVSLAWLLVFSNVNSDRW